MSSIVKNLRKDLERLRDSHEASERYHAVMLRESQKMESFYMRMMWVVLFVGVAFTFLFGKLGTIDGAREMCRDLGGKYEFSEKFEHKCELKGEK